MKLSTRSRYGTRIILELARRKNEGPIQAGDISSKQRISVKYLEQLIRTLKQARLVTSVRGPKGGHMLTKDPAEITLGQIVSLYEGQSELVGCISAPENCAMSPECKVRLAWQDATLALYRSLDNISIADLLIETPDGPDEIENCFTVKPLP